MSTEQRKNKHGEREKIYQDPGDEVVLRGDDAVSLTDSAVESRVSGNAMASSLSGTAVGETFQKASLLE